MSGRRLTWLFWVGVGATPIAAITLVVSSDATPLRFAAVLSVVGTVCVALSVMVREDPAGIREELSEDLHHEVGLVRSDLAKLRRGVEVTVSRELERVRDELLAVQASGDNGSAGYPNPSPQYPDPVYPEQGAAHSDARQSAYHAPPAPGRAAAKAAVAVAAVASVPPTPVDSGRPAAPRYGGQNSYQEPYGSLDRPNGTYGRGAEYNRAGYNPAEYGSADWAADDVRGYGAEPDVSYDTPYDGDYNTRDYFPDVHTVEPIRQEQMARERQRERGDGESTSYASPGMRLLPAGGSRRGSSGSAAVAMAAARPEFDLSAAGDARGTRGYAFGGLPDTAGEPHDRGDVGSAPRRYRNDDPRGDEGDNRSVAGTGARHDDGGGRHSAAW